MKGRLAIVAMVALAAAAPLGAQAPAATQGPQTQAADPAAARLERIMTGITLTPAQKAQVDSVVAQLRPQFAALPAGRDSTAMASRRGLWMRQDSLIRAVLTPEQQQVYDRNLAQARSQMSTRPQP